MDFTDVIIILVYLKLVESRDLYVRDKFSHNKLYVTHYCPKIGTCEEGTHVVCLYYNPNRRLGPLCHNGKNATITAEYAQEILNIINGIRSQVSRGLARGKDGEKLPRGYGINRLEWDQELATFAQLWANQCSQGTDFCRATSDFPDPGQMVGLNRFKFNWDSLQGVKFNKPGYTKQRERYAIVRIIKSWFKAATSILTPELVENKDRSPDAQSNLNMNHFVNMFSGPTTHIGCGISAFSEFVYDAANKYNSIRLVCNLSIRLHPGVPIYNITPPTEDGYTVKCGCPPNYDEDENCLCYKSNRNRDDVRGCKANLVILPIFTLENPPPSSLRYTRRRQLNSNRLSGYRKYDNEESLMHPANFASYNDNYNKSTDNNSRLDRNPSIFSRTSPFGTHKERQESDANDSPMTFDKIKKGVRPRKDFSKLQEIVDIYLNEKQNANYRINNKNSRLGNNFKENKNIVADIQSKKYNDNINKSRDTNADNNLSTDEKVEMLLNKLSEEIEYIDLDVRERQMIVDKIQNIYRTLLGNPNSLENNMYHLGNRDQKHYTNDHICNHDTTADKHHHYYEAPFNDDNGKSLKPFNDHDMSHQEKVSASDDTFRLKNKKIRNTLDIRQPKTINRYDVRKNNEYSEQDVNSEDILNYGSRSHFLNALDNVEEQLRNERAHNSVAPVYNSRRYEGREHNANVHNRAETVF